MAIRNRELTIDSANVKYTCYKYLNHIDTEKRLTILSATGFFR